MNPTMIKPIRFRVAIACSCGRHLMFLTHPVRFSAASTMASYARRAFGRSARVVVDQGPAVQAAANVFERLGIEIKPFPLGIQILSPKQLRWQTNCDQRMPFAGHLLEVTEASN